MGDNTKRYIKSFLILMTAWVLILPPSEWWEWVASIMWSLTVAEYLSYFIKIYANKTKG